VGLKGDEKMMRRKRIVVTVLIGVLLCGAIGLSIVGTINANEEATATQEERISKLREFMPDAPFGWIVESRIPDIGVIIFESHYGKLSAEEQVAVWISLRDFVGAGHVSVSGYNYLFYDYESREGYQSPEGYLKKVTIKGFPAWEAHNKSLRLSDGTIVHVDWYSLSVNINDQVVVDISTFNTDRDMLYDFSDLIDYKGIAALGEDAVAPAETAHPTEQPTQPSAKKTPTTPAEEEKTPGFEAVFVIAGLLAVAYILRRRK